MDASASLIVFLSAGYFASTNCRREVKHAVSTSKPLIIVKEDAFAKGGATVQELETECRAHSDHSQEVRYPLPPEVLEQVFGEDALSRIIPFARVRGFQLASLRMLAAQLCQHAPFYEHRQQLLERGLYIPGEPPRAHFPAAACLVYSAANRGASELAAELQDEAVSMQPGLGFAITCERPQALPTSTVMRCCLLYLTQDTFASEAELTGRLAEDNSFSGNFALTPPSLVDPLAPQQPPAPSPTAGLVRWALLNDVCMVLVHEQDPERGGCAFRRFFEVTPPDLVMNLRLFDKVAIPLYQPVELRLVSYAGIWAAMGARPRTGKASAIIGTVGARDVATSRGNPEPPPKASRRFRSVGRAIAAAISVQKRSGRRGFGASRRARRIEVGDGPRLELMDHTSDASASSAGESSRKQIGVASMKV